MTNYIVISHLIITNSLQVLDDYYEYRSKDVTDLFLSEILVNMVYEC